MLQMPQIPEEKVLSYQQTDIISQRLKRGDLVVAPTETVMGLMISTSSKAALDKLLKVKARRKPFQLLIVPIWLHRFAALPEELKRKLISLLPAPLTLVVPARESVLPGWLKPYVLDKGFIGLRAPRHSLLLEVIWNVGFPLLATSANPPGKRPASSLDEAIAYFGDSVDLYVSDENWNPIGASTVLRVYLEDGELRLELLREGPISLQEVKRALSGRES